MSLALSEVARSDQSVALIATGVVDDDTVEQFEKMLDSAIGTGSHNLVLDLTACRLASAGLAALIRQQRRLRIRSAAVALVATDVEMLRLLEIVGVTARFEIHATLDAAIGSAQSAARRIARAEAAGESRRVEVSVEDGRLRGANVPRLPRGLVCLRELGADGVC